MYRPSWNPRKICEFTLCRYSPPNLIVCAPRIMEKLSRKSECQKISSTAGSRKNGWPKRNEVPNPIPVSGTLDELTARRGRFSREYVKCASLSLLEEIVPLQFALIA